MEFCEKCGKIMMVKKKHGGASVLECTKCGREKPMKKDDALIAGSLPSKKKEIVIMQKGDEAIDLPKTKIMCPKCEHPEAWWWMQQTRSADEPPTLFYRCTKCNYSWRSYG
jgi:DNA-directed RNA polymerase subunit M